MREIMHSFSVAIVLCFLNGLASASYCYPDYCQNLTDLVPTPGFPCLLTRVQKGEGCAKLNFDDIDEKLHKQSDIANFALHAYVKTLRNIQEKTTAFNLSVSDINFHRLTTRYQHLDNEKKNENACRYIELYGNSSHPAPKDLYVSCPFSDAAFEGSPYRLEYLAIGKNYMYRKYIFYVPQHRLIEDGIPVETFTPFIYVDVSDSPNLGLYIQSLPASYNVMEYKVWLINNDTQSTISTIISTNKNKNHIGFNFSAPDGVYYVKVAALHPDCGENGCANSTSPFIPIKQVSHRLLIMIISLIWIPPVLLYALYHAFKLYRKKVLKRMAMRPNCLLVYSPTHPAHVNVMAELTRYLRRYNVNAMIDMFDIPETASKDPGLWCNTAFQTADIVLVATSPPISAKSDTIIYQNVDNHLLRLLKENYPQRNKRYYAVHLPYCKPDHIPEEARIFKNFRLPEDLAKLVKTIHGVGCLRFLATSDGELLESIRFATVKIFEDETNNTTKNIEETDDLLPQVVMQETANCDAIQPMKNTARCPDTPDCDIIPQSFATNIDELNLLGESGERKSFVFNPARNDCEFRIDKLNL